MREILFRGKRKDFDNEWLYGFYTLYNDNRGMKPTIITGTEENCCILLEVIPETVGQYTGLTDKNGNKIFEGDIVKHFDNSDEVYDIGEVYYDTNHLMWRRTTQGSFHKTLINSYKLDSSCIYEVIGNIHDNPELLKGGAE